MSTNVTINGKTFAVEQAYVRRGTGINYDFHIRDAAGEYWQTGISTNAEGQAVHTCRHTGISAGEKVTVGEDFMRFAVECQDEQDAISRAIRSGLKSGLRGDDLVNYVNTQPK